MVGERRGYHSIDGVLDPTDPAGGRRITVFVSARELDRAFRYTRTQGWGLLTAARVLRSPDRILRTSRWDEPDERPGWCYVGSPGSVQVSESLSVPLPADSVFVVFVNAEGVVYKYRVEDEDPDDPGSPLNAAERFGARVWPTS